MREILLPNYAVWCDMVRDERERRHLTRAQLAKLTGIADSTIRNVECGRHRATRVNIKTLSAYLDLPMPLSKGTETIVIKLLLQRPKQRPRSHSR